MPAMSRPNKSPKPSKARENSKPKAGTHAHAAAGVSPAATRGSQTSKDAKMAAGRGSNSQPADRGNRRATAGTAAAAAKGNNTMRCRLSVMARPLGDRISRAGPRAAPGNGPARGSAGHGLHGTTPERMERWSGLAGRHRALPRFYRPGGHDATGLGPAPLGLPAPVALDRRLLGHAQVHFLHVFEIGRAHV